MNRYFDAKLGMYKETKSFLEENSETVNMVNVTILNTYNSQLIANVGLIQTTSPATEINIKAITLTKTTAENDAVNFACFVAGMLSTYASDHIRPNPSQPASPDNPNNPTILQLKEDMQTINPSMLKARKDEEVVDALRIILNKAQEISNVTPPATNPLIPYGCKNDVGAVGDENYESGTLKQLETAIDGYEMLTASTRNAIAKRKSSNQELSNLFKRTDELLLKMDKIIDGLKDTNPEFSAGYKNARIIVGPIRLRTQITGKVSKITNLELGTTEVVNGAKIVITAAPYTTVKNDQTITVQRGPFSLQADINGNYIQYTPDNKPLYTVKCSLPGYQDIIKTDIKVKRGKKKAIDFLLVPVQQQQTT